MSTEEQLSLFAGDSLVSHSVLPASNSAQKMTEHSGRKCCELYEKWLPDGSLARMFLESSRWNSTMCYLTWKAKATPAGRLYFQLVPSMPSIGETGSGLWPTPTTSDANQAYMKNDHDLKKGNLRGVVKMWPTPQASDNRDRGNLSTPSVQRRKEKGKQLGLSMVASDVSGSLNPTWVEWLMGFPIGHTDLKPSETP